MHSEIEDADSHATVIIGLAGLTTDKHHGVYAIASNLLGVDAIREVKHRSFPGDAALVPRDGFLLGADPTDRTAWEILVWSRASDERKIFAVAHEVAEWYLKVVRYVGEDVEDVANAIAAALVAPRRPFIQAVKRHGFKLSKLALDFDTTQTCMALRYGEALRKPVAVLTRSRCRYRGETWKFHPQEFLRECVAKNLSPLFAEKKKITDAEGHWAFRYT
jgi:hypothetical protein